MKIAYHISVFILSPDKTILYDIFIDCLALAKQGDNALGNVLPSVRLSIRRSPLSWKEQRREESFSVWGVCLCVD